VVDFSPAAGRALLEVWGPHLSLSRDYNHTFAANQLWNALKDLELTQPPRKVAALRKQARKAFKEVQAGARGCTLPPLPDPSSAPPSCVDPTTESVVCL